MKKYKKVILSAILFFAITMPFRSLFQLMPVTEVRPASALPPAMGLLFGIPGVIGCAFGNLVADILSGYSPSLCILGFLAQFLYGYLPYKLWYGKEKPDAETRPYFHNVHHVLKYLIIVITDSFLMATVLGIMTQAYGFSRLVSQSTLLLFFNNLVFCLILGIPIIILAGLFQEKERKRVLSLNVRFVLIFLLLSTISATFVGIFAYEELYQLVESPMELWNRVYISISIDFFLLCGIAILFLWYLERNITIPIERLTHITRQYAEHEEQQSDCRELVKQCEDLSRLHGETGYLAAAFEKMMLDVEHYIADITQITAEKERIRTELQVAARLQADMLPDVTDVFVDQKVFSLSASMTPAKEVGGDFYDFFWLDEDRFVFLVADVSGKGVPAAMFMVVAKTLLQNQIRTASSPAQAFIDTNEALCANNKDGMFVTAWMGMLTISTGKLVFVNAGHNRPLVKTKEKEYAYVTNHCNFVLAGLEGIEYKQEELQLQPGDTLFLYTDGVTEATNQQNQLYGEERLEKRLNIDDKENTEVLLSSVWEDVSAFQGETEQFDDITMLALSYQGDGYLRNSGGADIWRMAEVLEFVDDILEEGKILPQISTKVLIAVDEIFSNICYYSKAEVATVGCKVVNGKVYVIFEDDGIPFNPLEQLDPDIKQDIGERKIGGLGIFLVKKSMDQMEYKFTRGKNQLTIGKENFETDS